MASRKRQTRGGARYNICSSEQYNCIVESNYKFVFYEIYNWMLCLKCMLEKYNI